MNTINDVMTSVYTLGALAIVIVLLMAIYNNTKKKG